MTLTFFGRGLFIGGLVALILSAAPAVVFGLLPAPLSDNFWGTVAGLLLLTIVPLSAFVASAGALLLLLGWLQQRGARLASIRSRHITTSPAPTMIAAPISETGSISWLKTTKLRTIAQGSDV